MGNVFAVWIGLLPFVMLFGAYEGPKVYWMWIGGFFLALYWIIRLIRFRLLTLCQSSLWFLVWIFVLGVASITGVHPVDSIIGGSYRHQGVLLFFTLFLISETLLLISAQQKQILRIFLTMSVVIESALVIEQKLLDWGSRPLGTFGEPNAIAGFLAIGLLWIIIAPRLQVWMRSLLYLLVLMAVAATGSRTGIAVATLMTIAVEVKGIMCYRVSALRVGVLLAGVFAVMIGSYVFIRVAGITRVPSLLDDRKVFWSLGVDAFTKRPLLGYGAESEEWVYEQEYKSLNIQLVDFMVDRSHNIFLDVTLWSGIIGLGVFIGWLTSIAKIIRQKYDPIRLVAIAAWILFACLQPVGVVQWVQLILLAGV